MPAAKVLNGLLHQDSTDKNKMQKFYKTFSSGNAESKSSSPKIANLTANFKGESSMKDRVPAIDIKLNERNVQKFLSKINNAGIEKPKVTQRRKIEEHTYENIERDVGRFSLLSKSDSFRSTIEQCKDDYSLIENVTVIEVGGSPEPPDAKNISKVLQSFDRILKEFTPPPEAAEAPKAPPKRFVPPKLQKAKTCSIIESRCILKKQSEPKTAPKPLDRTKSLYNLDTMEVMPLDSRPLAVEKKNSKYSTYKVTSKETDLKKLDVKTRILKKTLSNPPPAPVPVYKAQRRVERRMSDPKKKITRQNQLHLNHDQKPKILPKSKLQKAKSSWEVSCESAQPKILERTKSSTSIAGSPSKIPVVRGQPPLASKFGSTRAIFASTPGNLSQADQVKDVSKRKIENQPARSSRQSTPKPTKAPIENSVKNARDYANEISLIRAKLQKSRKSKPVTAETIAAETPPLKSPVKSIVSKLEKAAVIETPNWMKAPKIKIEIPDNKNRKYDGSSDCSDDSGHVSNENEPSVDSVDSSVKDLAKSVENRLSYKILNVAPVKPVLRRAVEELTQNRDDAADIDRKKEILFRGGALPALEASRDAVLGARIARLQACCRGALARRRAARLRVQHTAARCVQRNVRAFLAVRDWPWWRLLVRVQPLLAVHRTEDLLRATTEELETLRGKVEKLEGERSLLKHENGKLEAKLSETTAELAEERSAASLAAQRLDAETSERLRLDRDLRDLHSKNDKLQQASERLEVELVSARGAGGAEHASDTESGAGDADADAAERFRRRYERAAKELNAARAQLRRQHEDDLEQIVAVKKQLEKKLADAYEEADEQRQVAAGWKRKLQKLSNDAADLRSQLDEHSCRNNLLEKRQRKFDAELHAAHDELKRERSLRERTSRERDLAQAEKYAQDQNLADARMELELKEEKINALQKEIDEAGGGNGGDSELALLKKMKSDLEKKCHDQEEELDELAGQVQLLESSKLRLEMMLEQQRKESRIEAQQRDEELDEARSQAIKKVKALESQLEAEHGERTLLLRERHELERRLASLEEQARSENAEMEQQLQRLRRDVKRYRALLRDAQAMIEQKDSDAGTRAQIRDLKAQLEEAEVAVRTAQRAKSAAEQEASEATAAASEAQAARRDADQRATAALRDSTHNKSLLDDADEEAQELMKKYRACATALAAEQASARAAEAAREAGEEEARGLRERLADAQQRLAHLEAGQEHDAAEHSKLLELKTKELESKLELEQTTRSRLDGQISRLKDSQEKINAELSSARQKEQQAQDELRKLQRQFKEIREEVVSLSSRLEEATRARSAAEGRASAAATEAAAARRDARTAQRRAADLQAALAADLSPNTDNSHEDSDNDSYSSDESIETFLANHKISPTTPSKHNFQSDHSRSTDSRQSRSSAGSTKPSSPIKESFA